MINTNGIRAFADKVRAMQAAKKDGISMTAAEARNLNHEIEVLLAILVELQGSGQPDREEVSVEIKGNRF